MIKITLIFDDGEIIPWYGSYSGCLNDSICLMDWRYNNNLEAPRAVKISTEY